MQGAVRSGLVRGARTGWFLVRIIIPLSAGVALLDYTGILGWIGRQLAPVMGLFGLPGEAALHLVSGFFAGVYGGVAAASALTLTKVQMTVLAMIILVAHNLIVEGTIESRSGTSGLMVTGVRIATGLLMGAILWQILRWGDQGPSLAAHASSEAARAGFGPFAASWALGAAKLLVKIFAIVVGLMIATELMRAYGLFEALRRPMRPFMRFLGLSDRVTFLWLTATFLGIAYGAGLIIQEANEHGRFEPGDLRDLHVSIGISHSLFEDTLLFMAIGANPFWVLLPRPLAAAVVVRAVRRFVPDRPVRGLAPVAEETT